MKQNKTPQNKRSTKNQVSPPKSSETGIRSLFDQEESIFQPKSGSSRIFTKHYTNFRFR
jgi:hypothetical protein